MAVGSTRSIAPQVVNLLLDRQEAENLEAVAGVLEIAPEEVFRRGLSLMVLCGEMYFGHGRVDVKPLNPHAA